MNMNRSDVLEVIVMIKELLNHLDRRDTWKSSHIDDVRPSSTSFVLNQTIKMIEYLDGDIEDLQNKYNELQNSFEESQDDLATAQDELATANAAILKYEEAHNHLFDQLKRQISIVSELKEELRQMRIKIDEVEEARDNWKTEAIRRQNELNDIEMRNLMREKPAQECCEHCNKIDCSNCAICPF